jgi:hypothetical protein
MPGMCVACRPRCRPRNAGRWPPAGNILVTRDGIGRAGVVHRRVPPCGGWTGWARGAGRPPTTAHWAGSSRPTKALPSEASATRPPGNDERQRTWSARCDQSPKRHVPARLCTNCELELRNRGAHLDGVPRVCQSTGRANVARTRTSIRRDARHSYPFEKRVGVPSPAVDKGIRSIRLHSQRVRLMPIPLGPAFLLVAGSAPT